MKSDEFVTADHHFGHANIIRHSKRPFADAREMDRALIAAWNAKVPVGATVYHLGDFSWHSPRRTEEILWQLSGRIRLVRGNHERAVRGAVVERFEWIKDYHESQTEVGGIKVCKFHYAIQTWNQCHRKAWMLHGHSHGSLQTPDWMRRLDVGVDNHPDYAPWSFAEVEAVMTKRGFKAQDHHGRREEAC